MVYNRIEIFYSRSAMICDMKKLYNYRINIFICLLAIISLFNFSDKCYAFQDEKNLNFEGRKVGSNSIRFVNTNEQFPLIEFKGEWIIFSENDRHIKAMSPGAQLKITRVTFGVKRTIIVNSGNNEELRYKYFIGKKETSYKPEGEKWLNDMLIEVIRSTNLGAEQRVQRIYSNKGLTGVLAEIDEIEDDFAKQAYFNNLFKQNGLNETDYATIITSIRDMMDSDYEKAKLFRSIPEKYILHEKISPVYFGAIRDISEDFEFVSYCHDNRQCMWGCPG